MWNSKAGIIAAACVAAALAASPAGRAQGRAKAPASVRLYIFDCGVIKGLGVELFGFKKAPEFYE